MPLPRITSRRALLGLALPAVAFAERTITPGLVIGNVTGPQVLKYTNYIVRSRWQANATSLRLLMPDTQAGIERFEENPRVVYILPIAKDIEFRFNDGFNTFAGHDLHNQYGVVAVAPTLTDTPWFANHATNGQVQQERYMLEDIVPLVDNLFPRARARRLLLGFSKSGVGAFSLLLRNINTFHAAVAWDSPLFVSQLDPRTGMPDAFGTQDNYLKNYYFPSLVGRSAEQLRDSAARMALLGYSGYGQDMLQGNELLRTYSVPRYFDNGQYLAHEWDSGWVPSAMSYLDKMAPR